MKQIVTDSLTAVGKGAVLNVPVGSQVSYNIAGTFVGTVSLYETPNNGGLYKRIAGPFTAGATGTVKVADGFIGPQNAVVGVVLGIDAYTSGTITNTSNLVEGSIPFTKLLNKIFNVAMKVGATAGWVASTTGVDSNKATMAASQTAGTLVIPLSGLLPGDVLSSFHLYGGGIFTGTASTLDASLHSCIVSAAGTTVVDTNLQSMTQFVSATANVIFGMANTYTELASEHVVVEGETFYLLLTGTTAAGDSMVILGANVGFHNP